MKSDSSSCCCCRLFSPRWNAYVVGIGLGLLSVLVFWLADKPLGISTALSQASGACASLWVGWDGMLQNSYWAKHIPKWDYGTLFLLGTFLGACAAALSSKSFIIETIPSIWQQRFGPSKAKRMIGAFIGGLLAMFGARLAGGCTSGHGISGSLQLAVGSWTFFMVMFAAGVVTAWALFRKL